MELDLDHIERIATQRQEAGGRLTARPEVILAMVSRIRELESASQPGPSDKPVAFWNPAVDHDSAAFSYGHGGGYSVPLYTRPQASQPGGGEAVEVLMTLMRANPNAYVSDILPHAEEYLARAAPSAGNGEAKGEKLSTEESA